MYKSITKTCFTFKEFYVILYCNDNAYKQSVRYHLIEIIIILTISLEGGNIK